MHAWEAIQKTVTYLEEHLSAPLDVTQLAKLAALSPFYYQRLFSRLVGKPVGEYLKLRRLANACAALEQPQNRILDIALQYGFGSHQSFTRAFKQAYGITPETYRSSPVLLNQFDKPDLLLKYTMVETGVPLISDGLVLELNNRTLTQPVTFLGISDYVPLQGQMPLGEATGIDLPGQIWHRFHDRKHLLARKPGGRELGVSFLGDAPPGHFTYFAGAEVETDTADSRFTGWQLPAGDYLVCGFEAETFEQLVTVAINKAVKYTGLWLETHSLTVTMDSFAPEVYFPACTQPAYMELWMPAVPK